MTVQLVNLPSIFNRQPYDASQFSGFSFWVKGSMPDGLLVYATIPATSTPQNGGTCTDHRAGFGTTVTVGTEWAQYSILFSDLVSLDNGPVPFDPSVLLTIEFSARAYDAAYDIWIDDLWFL